MRIACLLSYPSIAFFTALFIPLAIGLPGCGGGANPSATVADLSSSPADMGDMMSCPAAAEDAGTPHSLSVKIQLTDDGMGVPFFAQNGSMVHVPKADLVGKQFVYATAKGGDQVANGKMIDIGAGTIGNDLTAMFTTAAHYPNGPWEMGLYIAVTPKNPPTGPQPGDLAAFDLTAPVACEPPVTGVSVRMTVKDADASVTLTNRYFIRF